MTRHTRAHIYGWSDEEIRPAMRSLLPALGKLVADASQLMMSEGDDIFDNDLARQAILHELTDLLANDKVNDVHLHFTQLTDLHASALYGEPDEQ